MRNRYEKEYFTEVIKNSQNLSDVCRNIGLKSFYGNRQTVKKNIEKYKLDISHFRYHKSGGRIKIPTRDILVENSTYSSTTCIKERLYEEGYKERKCELCGQGENWNNMKISLILDHINGINNDNRIENLRIVCPNCNAGLDTHGGKNISKNSKYNYSEDLVNKKYYCDCGNEMWKNSKCCKVCFDIKQRRVKRPDKEILLKDVEKLGYTGTGRKYNVSDNTIRKWLKK